MRRELASIPIAARMSIVEVGEIKGPIISLVILWFGVFW